MASDIGFIGIGMMGFQMAGNIRKKMPSSSTLYIFDVVEAACQRFIDKFDTFGPIKICRSSKEVAERSKTLITMLPVGDNAREVYLDPKDGIITASADADRLILECSTIDVPTALEIGKAITDAGTGIYIDSPVSGGVRGAEAGTLSFFCGFPTGDTESDPVAKRIWDTVCYMAASERVNFCGKLGTGLVSKTVNNYIGLSNIIVAAEGMAFGVRHGVDGKILRKCIRGSSGDSWAMDNAQPAPGVIEGSASSNGFQPLFTPRLCVKDVSLGIKAAQDVGIDATMGEVALKMYKRADEDPRTKNLDCSSVWLHVNDTVEAFAKSKSESK